MAAKTLYALCGPSFTANVKLLDLVAPQRRFCAVRPEKSAVDESDGVLPTLSGSKPTP